MAATTIIWTRESKTTVYNLVRAARFSLLHGVQLDAIVVYDSICIGHVAGEYARVLGDLFTDLEVNQLTLTDTDKAVVSQYQQAVYLHRKLPQVLHRKLPHPESLIMAHI
jgi:hypothetical protein